MTKRLPGTMQAGLWLPDNWIDDSGIKSRDAFAAFAMIPERNSKFTTVNLFHSFMDFQRSFHFIVASFAHVFHLCR